MQPQLVLGEHIGVTMHLTAQTGVVRPDVVFHAFYVGHDRCELFLQIVDTLIMGADQTVHVNDLDFEACDRETDTQVAGEGGPDDSEEGCDPLLHGSLLSGIDAGFEEQGLYHSKQVACECGADATDSGSGHAIEGVIDEVFREQDANDG